MRDDSGYKERAQWDAYDAKRNALSYSGSLPVVAHPPCRAWGVMAHMSFRNADWSIDDKSIKARENEKKLAVYSVDVVRKNGGVLEHPSGSKLFGSIIPNVDEFPDEFGGLSRVRQDDD